MGKLTSRIKSASGRRHLIEAGRRKRPLAKDEEELWNIHHFRKGINNVIKQSVRFRYPRDNNETI